MPRLCRCGQIVDKGQCVSCKPYRSNHRQTTAERGYDHKWRKLSERYRADNPLCEACLNEDKTVPATEVHHMIPALESEYHRLNRNNLMALCRKCHLEIEGLKRAGSTG